MRSTHRPTGTGAGARRGDGSLRMRDGATASGRPRQRSSRGKRVRSGGGLATDAACALPRAARRSSGEGARAGKVEFRRERVSRGRPGGPAPKSGGLGTCPVERARRRSVCAGRERECRPRASRNPNEEARGARREARGARREARGARREARGARREARGARREARGGFYTVIEPRKSSPKTPVATIAQNHNPARGLHAIECSG